MDHGGIEGVLRHPTSSSTTAWTCQVTLARRRRALPPWQGPTHDRLRGHGQMCPYVRTIAATVAWGQHARGLLLILGPDPHVLCGEDAWQLMPPRTRELSKFCPDPLVLYVEPVTVTKERFMHHHVPPCQHPASSRQCGRHHELAHRSTRRHPAPAGSQGAPGTSRMGPAVTREPWNRRPAGQGASPAVARDPDCTGRLAIELLRLIGGRR